jgi:uncharacterized protein (DUF1800 family)
MGDQSSVLSVAEARHLLRRTGFGAAPRDVDRIVDGGETRGEAVDRLLGFKVSKFRPRNKSMEIAHNKWIKYMIRTKSPLQEKTTLFWHDHFATSNDVVGDPNQMALQNQTLRINCKGDFRQMMHAVNRDPAMMDFLDTVRNRRQNPNENYARELLELFCLGVYDLDGQPNYTQDDIVQIARAFTGWRVDNRDEAYFDESRHDRGTGDPADPYPERGPKVIFKNNPAFGPAGYDFGAAAGTNYAAEIDEVMNALFAHQDSAGRNTLAHWIAYRLITYFADPDPSTAYVEAMVSASGFDTGFVVGDLLRAIFVSDEFYAPLGDPTKRSVKWPVDYVVSTLRLVGMKLRSRYQYINGGSYDTIFDQLGNMGQILFEPPSVFGWDWESAWVNSSTLLSRYGFARDVAAARGSGKTTFRPEKLFDFAESPAVDPDVVVDAVTSLFGVDESFAVGSSNRDALVEYLTDGGGGMLDFSDYDTRDKKLRGVIALVLQSPAYMLH